MKLTEVLEQDPQQVLVESFDTLTEADWSAPMSGDELLMSLGIDPNMDFDDE